MEQKITFISTNKNNLNCKDHAKVFSVAFCTFEAKEVIKEVIATILKMFLLDDANFAACEDADVYITSFDKIITVKEMREIINSIITACEIDPDEYAYDTKAEWEKAMEKYEEGMLNLAAYLNYLWI